MKDEFLRLMMRPPSPPSLHGDRHMFPPNSPTQEETKQRTTAPITMSLFAQRINSRMLHDPDQYFENAFHRAAHHGYISPSLSPTLSPSPSRNDNLEAPRPLRRCRSASPIPQKQPMLTAERQILIRKSWQRFQKSTFGQSWMSDLTGRVGRGVFGDDPTSIERHRRHFIELLQNCIDNLNDMDTALKPWLDLLGKGHNGFKIKARHWEAFGESLASTVTEWIGPGRSHKETIKGWMILSSFLADRLAAASRSAHSPMMTPRVQLMTFH